MQDKCASDDCGQALRQGDPVIQLTTGKYVAGYISPQLTPEETHNWHPACFHEFPLKDQYAPYACVECGRLLKDDDLVVYVCRGAMPARGYFRAESRGYTILYIAHVSHA